MFGLIINANTIGGAVIIILSIILLMGRGSFLIAGYNTMSKEEKEKYNTPALCKFIGKIFFALGLVVISWGFINLVPNNAWLWAISGIAFIGLIIFAIVYTNTGNRFRK